MGRLPGGLPSGSHGRGEEGYPRSVLGEPHWSCLSIYWRWHLVARLGDGTAYTWHEPWGKLDIGWFVSNHWEAAG